MPVVKDSNTGRRQTKLSRWIFNDKTAKDVVKRKPARYEVGNKRSDSVLRRSDAVNICWIIINQQT